ncbi:MAG: hypothetical protein ABEH38_10380 [Flavobacteriales bacterium]
MIRGRIRSFIPFFVILPLCLGACEAPEKKEKGKIVAEAYEDVLTEKELKDRVPSNLSGEDSQHVAETSIRNWVRERVMVRKAKEELSAEEQELRRRIADYRRSLLIHALEKKSVGHVLDSSVSPKELRNYYKEHQKAFQLDGPIIKKVHVSLNTDSIRYLSRFRIALRKDSALRKKAMKPLCEKHALDCSYKGKEWVRLDRFLTRYPLDIENEKRFLEKRALQRFDRKGNIFLLRILAHRSRNAIAPLSMVRDKVRRMIVNERKERVIERLHKKALLNARKKNEVRIP